MNRKEEHPPRRETRAERDRELLTPKPGPPTREWNSGVIEPARSADEEKDLHNAKVKAKIAEVEAGQARAIREATLTGDKARLQAIEDRITDLRKGLL